MSETLYIRLGSQSQDKIHWLVWSDSGREIIASGELDNAQALDELSEKASSRKVICFVPSCDVALKRLNVPAKSQRAIRLAAPYMLEDELAQDVDDLFFAYANLPVDDAQNNCFIAAVDREQISAWQQWLQQAEISCKQMLPDVLAMPMASEGATAVMLGEQILVRQGLWQGMTLDQNLWQITLSNLLTESDVTVEHFSTLPAVELADQEHQFTQVAQPEELPLAIMAQQMKGQTFNLLQGEFQFKEERSPVLVNWMWAAGIAAIALLLNLGIKTATLIDLNNQQAQLEQEIVKTYKSAFPGSKRVRVSTVRSVLKQKLNDLGQNAESEGFLTMLSKLRPAFISVPELKPQTLKFEGKRNEVRIQARAKDYQAFEKFKVELENEKLDVNQGSQNNQGDVVIGSFSIKG